jgi:hypothetical protein
MANGRSASPRSHSTTGGSEGSFAGIGRAAARIEDVPVAYREAAQALAVARRLGGRHRVAYFGTLGVYRVLASVEPASELAAFCEDTLGPLRALDQRSGGELLRTLEAYLLSGGSPQLTAERLHTHRNTVLYRLERIERALGVDLRQPERQLTLHLALRAAEVLGEARLETDPSDDGTSKRAAPGRAVRASRSKATNGTASTSVTSAVARGRDVAAQKRSPTFGRGAHSRGPAPRLR